VRIGTVSADNACSPRTFADAAWTNCRAMVGSELSAQLSQARPGWRRRGHSRRGTGPFRRAPGRLWASRIAGAGVGVLEWLSGRPAKPDSYL